MTKLIAVLAALAVAAVPAVAIGQGDHQAKGKDRARAHQRHHPRQVVNRVAHRLVAQQCRTERQQLGQDAFRARYGTPHALRRCVNQHVKAESAKVRAAAKACRAERKESGKKAFRAKYGTPHALRNCVRAHVPAPATS